jgi:hypothetical protein
MWELADEHTAECAFARAVWTDQTDDLARPNRQRDVVDGPVSAEVNA